jgi:hypothetical protein
MKITLEEAKSVLWKSKDDMTCYYNQRLEPTPVYRPGDKVYLDASDSTTTHPSQKLSHQFLVLIQWYVPLGKMLIVSDFHTPCINFTWSSMLSNSSMHPMILSLEDVPTHLRTQKLWTENRNMKLRPF